MASNRFLSKYSSKICKYICFIVLLLLFSNILQAQQYGNEWINFNQSYYKIPICCTDGIYRIGYNALQQAGINTNSFDPRSFQIFHAGEEQYIYVYGEQDGVFNTNDYIEFYAKPNDGWLDSRLFEQPSHQMNSSYSLFNDTAIYFLTWNSSISNRRMMIETDNNFSAYQLQPYFFKEIHQEYPSKYYYGDPKIYGYADFEYSAGKGWFDEPLDLGGSKTKILDTKFPYTGSGSPNSKLYIGIVGASNQAGVQPDHHLRIFGPNFSLDTAYEGYTICRFYREFATSHISHSGTSITFNSINDLGSNADKSAVAYIKIIYPHTHSLENKSSFHLIVPDNSQGKSYFSFSDFNISASDVGRLYDLDNHKRIDLNRSGSNFQVLVPNAGGNKHCYISSELQVNEINNLIPVNAQSTNPAKFVNFLSSGYFNSNYIIISHRSLMNEAENYRNYRNLSGYKTLLANVDHIYEQFGYGVSKHPIAIKNFITYLFSSYPEKPKYLFLIGRGITADYRNRPEIFNQCLVPSYGVPPSDLMFSNKLNDPLYKPALATGRLAASTSVQVSNYLDKVMQYEANANFPQEWMKQVLHFGGGGNAYEQNVLRTFLLNYQRTIEAPYFGGNVKTFLKTSSAPIQEYQSEYLKTLINNGVSIMTFFGHAAGIGWDMSIDDPSVYENYGKYPFLISNSCFSGDIFGPYVSSSDAFVLIKNKGVIGYLGSHIQAGISELNEYSDNLYKKIAKDNYGKPIGECIQATIQSIQTNSFYSKGICMGMTLHGDPAIIINSHTKPDYEITTQNVYTTPNIVNTEIDSFALNVIIKNIGKAISDSLTIEVKRIIDNDASLFYFKRVRAPYYLDTIPIKIPVMGIEGTGLNRFEIYVDCYNQISELSEINNKCTYSYIIKSSELIPIDPPKYAIVPNAQLSLKASTGYAFASNRYYVFEIDTTDTFNSPFKLQYRTNQSGGVVSWDLPFLLTDSMVYYWRVSNDSAYYGSYNWKESSFQYIANKNGWGQAHFFQFKNNKYQYVQFNRQLRRFYFINDKKSLYVATGYYPYTPWFEEQYRINNVYMAGWHCSSDVGHGLKIAYFNPVSFEPVMNNDHTIGVGIYGNLNCLGRDVPAFDFSTETETDRNAIKDFINNIIPEGYYVLIYSHRNHNAPLYSPELVEAFQKIGSSKITTALNGQAYVLFGIKKNTPQPNTARKEEIGQYFKMLYVYDTIQTSWKQGFIESEVIGPATKWKSLHWRFDEFDARRKTTMDSVKLFVVGITNTGTIDTLIRNLPKDSLDIYNLDQRIDAAQYPRIKLIAYISDDSLHTPVQLKRWQVLFDGVPETAINPKMYFNFYKDTLQEGDFVRLSTAFHNISRYPMDSLLVKYWIVDKNRNIVPVETKRLRKHPAGDILIDSTRYNTRNLLGLNSLWVEINPNNDQPEYSHSNNMAEVYFFVTKDNMNPLLDVTFDGVHILDGDIVSGKPHIVIQLNDENKFIALNDTALFKIWLKKPNQNEASRVYFYEKGQEQLKFFPAQMPKNVCKVEYNPIFEEDGMYQLRVSAKDESNNESGDYDYFINFKVINKSTITEVLNYPNPFTTSTRFVFTLTGSELPTVFNIQIMTISGKVVREITLDELGPIHIGRNITQYAWDGTDMFGDRLANGVYFYRVITEIAGKDVEKQNTQAQKYFHKEFGKMVILR